MKENIRQLALDIYNKKVASFTKEDGTKMDANEALRELLLQHCGGKWSYRAFNRVSNEFFEIIEEIITDETNELTLSVFEPIMDFKVVGYGEKVEFTVDDNQLFEVSIIANGTDNLYRQRIINGKVPTQAFDLGVAIYNDWDEFMAGKIDWTKLVNRVVRSMNAKIAELVGQTFAKGYDTIGSELKVEGTMKEESLVELCEKVGAGATIYGTKLALSKIPSIQGYVTDADDIRNEGYLKKFRGIDCVELENHYDKDAKKFSLPNDTLYIVPAGGKVLVGAFEGDAHVYEDTNGTRKDRQIEYFLTRRLHIGLAVASRYGAYKVTA